MNFLSWAKANTRLILASSIVSFLSASISGISLVLIQGVFGKEKPGHTTDVARNAIDFLGADKAVLVAIGIWGFSTYFLNNFNERLTSKRLEKKRVERRKLPSKITSDERRILVNESHFFESVIGYINHIIRTLVFAFTLFIVSPSLIKVDVLVSIGYILLICKQRFQQGFKVSSEDRESKRVVKEKRKDKDFSKDLDVFVKRTWLSAKLDNPHLLIFILLIVTPFILSDIFSLKILDRMVLFNFTTLLVFFSNAIHLAIQSANVGFRFHTVFADSPIDDGDDDSDSV